MKSNITILVILMSSLVFIGCGVEATDLPQGLGPAALVTELDWPTNCGTGPGSLNIGPSKSIFGSPSYNERQALACIPHDIKEVWQALQIPTGIDVAFWPERLETDCSPKRDVETGYAVSFLTTEIPHGGIQSHYTFDITWRADITQGTTSEPTEVKMFYGKTAGTVEVPWIRGSMVFIADTEHPGWTKIALVRQINTNGHSDEPTKLKNWMQDFFDGLQTQLTTGALTPRYCNL